MAEGPRAITGTDLKVRPFDASWARFMKHKRNGPKSTRSGCLLCKPHKRQGVRRLVKVKGLVGERDLRVPVDDSER